LELNVASRANSECATNLKRDRDLSLLGNSHWGKTNK
jgi:hypothetical protein